MSNQSLFDLSELTVSSISVSSATPEGLTEGHGMTELAGSTGPCQRSIQAWVGDEDDLV